MLSPVRVAGPVHRRIDSSSPTGSAAMTGMSYDLDPRRLRCRWCSYEKVT
jgi:argininosuccinate lyase